jgi:hypothetical protein
VCEHVRTPAGATEPCTARAQCATACSHAGGTVVAEEGRLPRSGDGGDLAQVGAMRMGGGMPESRHNRRLTEGEAASSLDLGPSC